MKSVPPAYRQYNNMIQGTLQRHLGGRVFRGLISDMLLVELKIVKALDDAHRMQCTNYLKATGL
jgi:PD-(D/E)XK nuclease superfamily